MTATVAGRRHASSQVPPSLLGQKVLMPDDTGFILDLGMRLPPPASLLSFFLAPNFRPRFYLEAQETFDDIPKSAIEDIFDLDQLVGLFRFQVDFPHRHFRAEIPSTHAARGFVLRRFHGMAATATHVTIFPRAVAEMFLFHDSLIGSRVRKHPCGSPIFARLFCRGNAPSFVIAMNVFCQ